MDNNDLTLEGFGKMVGVGPETVRRYMVAANSAQRRIPDYDVMRRIYSATKGEVAPNDFYDLPTLSEAA